MVVVYTEQYSCTQQLVTADQPHISVLQHRYWDSTPAAARYREISRFREVLVILCCWHSNIGHMWTNIGHIYYI